MFGVFALFVTAGVCAGIVGIDSYRKQEYEAKQKNAEEQWKKAHDSFFQKATNRLIESDLEEKLRKVMFGSRNYPEIVDEIKSTYNKWINDEPFYIKYLRNGGSVASGKVYDYAFDTMLTILMANRGYVTTGIAVRGIEYNSANPASQGIYLARQLDEMLKKKEIDEELYFKQTMEKPHRLSYGDSSMMGYTGCIFWKPKDPSLYL